MQLTDWIAHVDKSRFAPITTALIANFTQDATSKKYFVDFWWDYLNPRLVIHINIVLYRCGLTLKTVYGYKPKPIDDTSRRVFADIE